MRNQTAPANRRSSPDINQYVSVEAGEVREILTGIVEEIVGDGAWLNPALRIVNTGSEFSIQCPGSASSERLLIRVPSRCLLPIHQFEVSHQNGVTRLIKSQYRVTKTRQRLMELTLAFYNATGKVENFARNSPEITLGPMHPLTLALALGEGSADPAGARRATVSTPLDDDALKLRQFFGSRVYGTRSGSLRSVLIPVVDLLNHHPSGPGFNEVATKKYISVDISHQLPEEAECYVNYGNNKDTLDFFRFYHFVPLDVPHVFSIPMVLSPTSNSFIHINRGYREHQLGESHFIRKLPPRLTLEDNRVSCENIRISELHKRDNLAVGIDFMLKMLGRAMGFKVTRDMIRETQFNLLEENRHFYSRLTGLATSEPVTPSNRELLENVVLMCERQLAILHSYARSRGLH